MKIINYITREKLICFFLIVAILATIIFIFSNSLKNKAESSVESSNVASTVKPVIDPSNKIPFQTFEYFVRKYAHFLEFMLLGAELFALLFTLSKSNLKNIKLTGYLSILLISTLTALGDETLQIATNRGAALTDVWIDIAGSFTGTVLCFLFLIFVLFLTKRIQSKKVMSDGD